MQCTKNKIAVMLAGVLGTGAGIMPGTASAVLLDGSWALTIVPTPTKMSAYGDVSFVIGRIDGNWSSSFTFENMPSNNLSQGMSDNGVLVGGIGSSIAGDGFAGIIEMNVSGGSITVPGTSMTGFVDGSGNMTFNPTGRMGMLDLFSPTELPFFIDDVGGLDASGNPISNGNTAWTTFSTGSASVLFANDVPGTINGSALVNAGDLDGDGIDDFQGLLVSGGRLGTQFGNDFAAGSYFETWQIEMLSGTSASGFNVDTVFNTPGGDYSQYSSVVPVPAALYLFGTGLVALVGVAQRKKV